MTIAYEKREGKRPRIRSRERLERGVAAAPVVATPTASGLAHDLNNSLQIVTGAIEVIRLRLALGRKDVSFPLDQAASATERASQSARRIFVSEGASDRIARVDVNESLARLIHALRLLTGPLIELKGGTDARSMIVLCDEVKLENAVINLVKNARSAISEGGRVTVGLSKARLTNDQASLAAGWYAAISVSDSGTGIPCNMRHRIFEPRFSTKLGGEGAGLGLPAVKEFVEEAGGHVAVQSALGQGTTFIIYLPLADHE